MPGFRGLPAGRVSVQPARARSVQCVAPSAVHVAGGLTKCCRRCRLFSTVHSNSLPTKPKMTSPKAKPTPPDFSKSPLPADVRERMQTRYQVAEKALEEVRAYAAKQGIKTVP